MSSCGYKSMQTDFGMDVVHSVHKCSANSDLRCMPSCVPTDEANQHKLVGQQYGTNLLLLLIASVAAPADVRGIQLPDSLFSEKKETF